MSNETIKLLFERLSDYCHLASINNVEIIWHGGEPLLMGPEFYKNVHYYSSTLLEPSVRIKHSIQSNLLLYDDSLYDIFKKLNMRISSSVDPISGIRLMKNGGDYLRIWIDKLMKVINSGFNVGLICVIHRKHSERLKEVIQFFENLYSLTEGKTGIRYNALYFAGKARKNDLYDKLSITPEEWGDLLIRLWSWWNGSGRKMDVSPLSEWAAMFERYQSGLGCLHCENCAKGWLGVNKNGEIYNCGRHMDSGSSPYGNIYMNAIDEIVKNPERLKLFHRSELLKKGECKNCPIWEKCYGGCPDEGYLYTGDHMRKTHWCKSYLKFYKEVFLRENEISNI
jgi:radical SAM protein with 4Fe4S-binding SPASM domain